MTAPIGVCVALLLAGGCESELVHDLEGKQCRETGAPCLPGYVCDERNICVREGQGGFAGAEAFGGSGGRTGGRGGGAGNGRGGDGSGGNAGSSSGAGGTLAGTGGAGGATPLVDSGIPDASFDGGDGGCIPVMLFEDVDGDTFGNTSVSEVRCPADGWVAQPGDCRDDQPNVYPGQTDFFGMPYPDPSRPERQNVSFDYDCVNGEEVDQTNTPPTLPPNCADLILACEGSGYLPALPSRTGAGVEPRCGSVLRRICTGVLLDCNAEDSTLDSMEAFRCK